MGKGVGESPAGAAPMDVFAQAEALNAVSKTYDVEIDGVPLQRMSTVELSKLAASRGLPPSHARGELIGAIAPLMQYGQHLGAVMFLIDPFFFGNLFTQ